MFNINRRDDGVIIIELKGRLTRDSYIEELIPKLSDFMARFGALSVLIKIPYKFEGWELGAMLEDAKFGLSHFSDFKAIALVGDAGWLVPAAFAGRLALRLRVKSFRDMGSASSWLVGVS